LGVEETIEFLENKHSWSALGEEGKRIQDEANLIAKVDVSGVRRNI